jgi:hypothetical protein
MRLKLGEVVITPGAEELLRGVGVHVFTLLARHEAGDWGDVSKDDWELNDADAAGDGRVLSAYKVRGEEKVWIITEWTREYTTILLPEEY